MKRELTTIESIILKKFAVLNTEDTCDTFSDTVGCNDCPFFIEEISCCSLTRVENKLRKKGYLD